MRVKSTVELINKTKGTINPLYDATFENITEIRDNSKDTYELISNSFIFGFAQGMKAATATK